MGMVTLYTGGCRSGKSEMAVDRAKASPGEVCFIATCVAGDDEMKMRVEKHRRNRPAGWKVIEEPVDVAGAIESVDSKTYPVVIVDCLTLWVCNLMCRENDPVKSEEDVAAYATELAEAASKFGGDVIFVTNEVGMGVIPANEMARNYADLAGRCNQIIAKGADEVIMAVSGQPLVLKTGAKNGTT